MRTIYTWVGHHRLHHKFTETNADPHNASRGFFFSHIGWLMVKPHPDIEKFSKTIDMTDLEKDHIVMFQHRFYAPLIVVTGLTTVLIPFLCWDESMMGSLFGLICGTGLNFHATFFVNSISHMYGSKPYDKGLSATDSTFFSIILAGEGLNLKFLFDL
jgi:stearoyl-CoA desaturase (Delta-9 desaturase)